MAQHKYPNLCTGSLTIVTDGRDLSKHADKVTWLTARDDPYGEASKGIGKRKRLTCPVCNRRMIASVYVCDDGCCFFQRIPPHKPKGWWKKK